MISLKFHHFCAIVVNHSHQSSRVTSVKSQIHISENNKIMSLEGDGGLAQPNVKK